MPSFDRPIAHRGLHDRAAGVIENSRSAFAAAIARGFAIECDLQLTSDGHPVVFHDADRLRLQGVEGKVHETSLADMAARPLSGSRDGDRPQAFEDFLAQVGGQVLVQIELKHQPDAAATTTLARRTVEALRNYDGPVALESFDPVLVRLVREMGFTGPRGIITYDYREGTGPAGLGEAERYELRHLLHWRETRFDFISCDMGALGLPVTAWTVKSPEAARTALETADQIVFEGFDPEKM